MNGAMEMSCFREVTGNHATASPSDVVVTLTAKKELSVTLHGEEIEPCNLVGIKTGHQIVCEWAIKHERTPEEWRTACKYLRAYSAGCQLEKNNGKITIIPGVCALSFSSIGDAEEVIKNGCPLGSIQIGNRDAGFVYASTIIAQ